MPASDDDLRARLADLGEDAHWEFKQIEFSGDRPKSPTQQQLADELAAFANAEGGTLLCGVTDSGELQHLSRDQMEALELRLVEACRSSIKPPIAPTIARRKLDGRAFIEVEVAAGDAMHRSPGGVYLRVGSSKREMSPEESLRLAERRSQARLSWFDRQPVAGTGLASLDEGSWKPLISASSAHDPGAALFRMGLLADDQAGRRCATVAGLLLCAANPQLWLPSARVVATCYSGTGRATGQIDARDIGGPISRQIAEAAGFVLRNSRVAARKDPARADVPQFSARAVFEATVNAVVHRDYSIKERAIRISVFADRVELESPGALANGLTVDNMALHQSTRNEAIASVLRYMPVGELPGAQERRYFMETRGDGVTIIMEETRKATGREPLFELDGETLRLTIPSAELEPTAATVAVTVRSGGRPLAGVEVLALFPNATWMKGTTGEHGETRLQLHSTHLPMTVFAAAPGLAAGRVEGWVPAEGALSLELDPVDVGGGSVILEEATGEVPGLLGRLNPIRDHLDRTYLYASRIAINDGAPQPVHFAFGETLRLADSLGADLEVEIVDIVGRSALVQYRQADRPPQVW